MHCYVLLNSWSSIQINLNHVFPCDDIWQLAISDKKKKTTNNCNLSFKACLLLHTTYKNSPVNNSIIV